MVRLYYVQWNSFKHSFVTKGNAFVCCNIVNDGVNKNVLVHLCTKEIKPINIRIGRPKIDHKTILQTETVNTHKSTSVSVYIIEIKIILKVIILCLWLLCNWIERQSKKSGIFCNFPPLGSVSLRGVPTRARMGGRASCCMLGSDVPIQLRSVLLDLATSREFGYFQYRIMTKKCFGYFNFSLLICRFFGFCYFLLFLENIS